MNRVLYLGTNLKMYKTPSETVAYLKSLSELTADLRSEWLTLFVIPSFTAIPAAVSAIGGSGIQIGAQNMHWASEGQFTGEISARMLQDCQVRLVEIGHSERRHVFHESDHEIGLKVEAAVRNGFTALLCVGETAEQKAVGMTEEILRIQVKTGLRKIGEPDSGQVWIAYEPVWAIGTDGQPAEPDYAERAHSIIHKALVELYPEHGSAIPVLYGGSVNPANAVPMISQPSIDGLFIGRSAWQAESFDHIIRSVHEVWLQKCSLA